MTHERRHDCLLKKVQFTALSITLAFQGAQMKLAFFDDFKVGVVAGDSVVDVTDVVKHISRLGPQVVMRGVIERFDALEGKLADAAAKGQGKPVSQVRFRPPLPRPENIICMAVNYMEDGTLAEPAPINAFMKSPSAITSNRGVSYR